MNDVTHVIRDAASPVTDGIDVWTMWCGAQCLAMPDGELIPVGFDFYEECCAEKADCPGCKAVLYGTATSNSTDRLVPA